MVTPLGDTTMVALPDFAAATAAAGTGGPPAGLRLVEADQVATPEMVRQPVAVNAVDGIVFDTFGNPVEYHVLRLRQLVGLETLA